MPEENTPVNLGYIDIPEELLLDFPHTIVKDPLWFDRTRRADFIQSFTNIQMDIFIADRIGPPLRDDIESHYFPGKGPVHLRHDVVNQFIKNPTPGIGVLIVIVW